MVAEAAGGTTCDFDTFVERASAGAFSAVWIVGGYPTSWVPKALARSVKHFSLLVVQDLFESALTDTASVVLPACALLAAVEKRGFPAG